MERSSIIIIGAGVAGMAAARILSEKFEVTILEATDRVGGRCLTIHGDGFSEPVEGGAEFMHGLPRHTLELLQEASLQYEKVENRFMRIENGNRIDAQPMDPHWDEMLQQMKSVIADATLEKFLNENFPGDEYEGLRRHAVSFAEGFDLADPKTASIKSLYREWMNEEEQYRINGGYGALTEWMHNDCISRGVNIMLNQVVRLIEWNFNEVTVTTESDQIFKAQRCLITVPVRMLCAKQMQFSPTIEEYIDLLTDIGVGSVIKIVIEFNERFWKEDTGFLSDNIIPTWWTQQPRSSNILTGWLGGPPAERLSAEDDDTLLSKAFESLSNIFDLPAEKISENVRAAKVFNWQKFPFARGGYSFSTTHTSEARGLLNNPMRNTLYFAGEGISAGDAPGTVEAALASAIEQCEKILTAQ